MTHRANTGPGIFARASKALGTLCGSATAAGVATVLHVFGVDLDPEALAALVGLLAPVGTYLAPANK